LNLTASSNPNTANASSHNSAAHSQALTRPVSTSLRALECLMGSRLAHINKSTFKDRSRTTSSTTTAGAGKERKQDNATGSATPTSGQRETRPALFLILSDGDVMLLFLIT